MLLTRWQPFSEMSSLQRQLNRLFDDRLMSHWPDDDTLLLNPPVELSETDEAIHLKLEIPGMKSEDLDIQVTKDSVAISGERKQENKTEENGVTKTEFRYGRFQRVIPLGASVQNTDVTAEYKDGILTIVLPKTDEEKNKVVKVQIARE